MSFIAFYSLLYHLFDIVYNNIIKPHWPLTYFYLIWLFSHLLLALLWVLARFVFVGTVLFSFYTVYMLFLFYKGVYIIYRKKAWSKFEVNGTCRSWDVKIWDNLDMTDGKSVCGQGRLLSWNFANPHLLPRCTIVKIVQQKVSST